MADLYKKSIQMRYNYNRDGYDEALMKKIITDEYPLNPLELLGETSFGPRRIVPESEIGTPVQEFYRGAQIFITGGTGFVGKILIEKLLRTCPHIKRIFLLVRAKKGQEPKERIKYLFNDRMFLRLKHEVGNFENKVTIVEGSLDEVGLGMSLEDRKTLEDNVNVVFHVAATVRFNETLDRAVSINLLATGEIVHLAKRMPKLKVFMHVSTAYAHCPHVYIEEKFYPTPIHYKDVLNEVAAAKENGTLEDITPKILGQWPNTYTFTKALAENLIAEEASDLPVAIFRPTVIISTYKEPVRGWMDNWYGPIALIGGACTGVLHIYEADLGVVTDMVPVDLVVNCLICSATYVSKDKLENKSEDIPIYTYTSKAQNPISWDRILAFGEEHAHDWPAIKSLWYYSLVVTDNPLLFTFLNFFLHTLLGHVLDNVAGLFGKKPILTKMYTNFGNAREILLYFQDGRWVFDNKNTRALWNRLTDKDRELFFFDISQMSWDYYLDAMYLGLRVYLVNDDIDTLPAARAKWKKLYYAHLALRCIFYSIVAFFLWIAMKKLFGI